MLWILLTLTTLLPLTLCKQGSCPPKLPVDLKEAQCSLENPCDPSQLCCPTWKGGAMCVDPVTPRISPKLVKLGSCPSQPKGPWICSDSCSGDSDCPRTLKCCPNRCGALTCLKPDAEDATTPAPVVTEKPIPKPEEIPPNSALPIPKPEEIAPNPEREIPTPNPVLPPFPEVVPVNPATDLSGSNNPHEPSSIPARPFYPWPAPYPGFLPSGRSFPTGFFPAGSFPPGSFPANSFADRMFYIRPFPAESFPAGSYPNFDPTRNSGAVLSPEEFFINRGTLERFNSVRPLPNDRLLTLPGASRRVRWPRYGDYSYN